ncbi:hypothetical protein DFA_05818 [Cavenderia fasciculata]|uniref:Ankyrin repeat-containing protein n=1 Tax=Cavenderia fasciculata TaxID=261658 RepID=F4PMU0_CACFS|nr:uncharacterized protein DFA_05818 [Cavenderia fasciculata]EGG23684.1 hypothetical protein DFA_05818 [Cavenderia fasciculata]|eukprot:XP_004361535.1 hypothetical protein DFA_05818 [Cavenderia fasciculata]
MKRKSHQPPKWKENDHSIVQQQSKIDNTNNNNSNDDNDDDHYKTKLFKSIIINRYISNIIFNFTGQLNKHQIQLQDVVASSSSSSSSPPSPSSYLRRSLKGKEVIERGSLVEMIKFNMTNHFFYCFEQCGFGEQMLINKIPLTDLFLAALYYGNLQIAQHLADHYTQAILLGPDEKIPHTTHFELITNDIFNLCIVKIYNYHNNRCIPTNAILRIIERSIYDGTIELFHSVIKYCFVDIPIAAPVMKPTIANNMEKTKVAGCFTGLKTTVPPFPTMKKTVVNRTRAGKYTTLRITALGIVDSIYAVEMVDIMHKNRIFEQWQRLLHHACQKEHYPLIEFIQKNVGGVVLPLETSYSIATKLSSGKLLKYLCELWKPPLDISDVTRAACDNGNIEALDYLIGLSKSSSSSSSNVSIHPSCLSEALGRGHIGIVKYLLKEMTTPTTTDHIWSDVIQFHKTILTVDLVKLLLLETNNIPLEIYINALYYDSLKYKEFGVIEYIEQQIFSTRPDLVSKVDYSHLFDQTLSWDNIDGQDNQAISKYASIDLVTPYRGVTAAFENTHSVNTIKLIVTQFPWFYSREAEKGVIGAHEFYALCHVGRFDVARVFLENNMVSGWELPSNLDASQVQESKDPEFIKLFLSVSRININNLRLELIFSDKIYPPLFAKESHFKNAAALSNTGYFKVLYKYQLENGDPYYFINHRDTMVSAFTSAVLRGNIEILELMKLGPKESLFFVTSQLVDTIVNELSYAHSCKIEPIVFLFDRFKEQYRKNDKPYSLDPTNLLVLTKYPTMTDTIIYILELFISKKSSHRQHKCFDRSPFSKSFNDSNNIIYKMLIHSLKHNNFKLFNYLCNVIDSLVVKKDKK